MRKFMTILLTGLWITLSEFVRNEFLLKVVWEDKYNEIGLVFKTTPTNGLLWMAWSFALAYVISVIMQKFTFKETLLITWIAAFLMMWIVTYNLQVLPIGVLGYAIPLSLVEILIAQFIIRKINKKGNINEYKN